MIRRNKPTFAFLNQKRIRKMEKHVQEVERKEGLILQVQA